MDIKYEKMTKNDHKDIKRLITEAWFSDYTFKDFYIKLYASGYLNMYLAHADYKVVAKDGDKVVGFIFELLTFSLQNYTFFSIYTKIFAYFTKKQYFCTRFAASSLQCALTFFRNTSRQAVTNNKK